MSFLVDYEEDLDLLRGEVYSQLEKLVKDPPKYLSAATKKAFQKHCANFHFGYEWIEDGEDLILKARKEQWAEAERRNRYEEFERFAISPWIDNNTKELWDLAEGLEENLDKVDQKSASKQMYDSSSLAGTSHRAGLKRDKTKLWNRPQPTRRKQTKRLAKQKMLQHQQRQPDNQLQE